MKKEKDNLIDGIVFKSTGSWYAVKEADGRLWKCRMTGKFRLNKMMLTNPVAVGDAVRFLPENDEEALIKEIMPRKNYIVRQSPHQKHMLHLLAANVDQAIVIVTIIEPNLKQGFIDRFILMTEPQDIPAIIIFNKLDLYGAGEKGVFNYLRDTYESIGYAVLAVSSVTGENLPSLKEILQNKTTLVAGQSGVGKSTLINTLQPRLDLRTTEISDYSGKGQHTTTFAEMFELDFGGFIIDTPGIKTLSFNNLEPSEVAHNFRELFEHSRDCKFGGSCTHRNEPNCAVLAAVAAGTISELRYMNYLKIMEELEEQNHWERHKNL